jgi:hemoglobin
MKQDVSSRKDSKQLIIKFYDKLLVDEKMIPFFIAFVKENQLEHHFEIIADFWNDIIFDSVCCGINVMQKHLDKNVFVRFKKEHFTLWVSYFLEAIDTYFIGENSERMKSRVQSIATVM